MDVGAVKQVGDVPWVVARLGRGHARSGATIVLGGRRVVASRFEDGCEVFVAVDPFGEARDLFPRGLLGFSACERGP